MKSTVDSRQSTAEVAIVGASVAGAAAALYLARRHGRRVLLLDRARFPRDKACGEGILPHGVALLEEIGALPELERLGAQRFRGIRYHDGRGGPPAEGELPEVAPGHGEGLACRRLVLDAVLADLARRERPNIELHEGVRVRALLRDPATGRVTGVESDGDERFLAPVVVGADGPRSVVRRLLGLDLPPPRRLRYGVCGHFARRSVPVAVPDSGFVDVILGDFGGELYVTPVSPDEVHVALLVERRAMRRFAGGSGSLEAAFAAIVRAAARKTPALAAALAGADGGPGDPRPSSPVLAVGPLASRARRAYADGAILLGDAAGFVDALTGEGIASALLSARAAAETIDRALARGDVSAATLAPFAARRDAIVREPDRLTRLVLALSRARPLARLAIRALRARPSLFRRLLAVSCGALRLRDALLAPRGEPARPFVRTTGAPSCRPASS